MSMAYAPDTGIKSCGKRKISAYVNRYLKAVFSLFKAAKVMLSDSFEIIGLMIGALLAALLMQPLRLIPSGWHLLPVAVILYAGLMFGGARAGKKYRIRNISTDHFGIPHGCSCPSYNDIAFRENIFFMILLADWTIWYTIPINIILSDVCYT